MFYSLAEFFNPVIVSAVVAVPMGIIIALLIKVIKKDE